MKQTNDELTAIRQWLGDAPETPPRAAWMRALDALYARAPAPDQAGLRRALAEAQRRVSYDSITDTHLGKVFFAATAAGLVSIDFGTSERAFRERLRAHFGVEARLARAPGKLGRIGKQLREYLAGRRTQFDLALDLGALPEFQRRVLLAALEIPHGQVTTYGELARRIGRPKAARAVGQALGHNPVPIVIPCHRVLGSDGSLHGYGAGKGLPTKAWLLALEGARFG